MVRYTCMRMMLPTVEAALAAHGYSLEYPFKYDANGDRIVLLTHVSAAVLLSEWAQSEVANIDVYGACQRNAVELLERLPISLAKQSLQHEANIPA